MEIALQALLPRGLRIIEPLSPIIPIIRVVRKQTGAKMDHFGASVGERNLRPVDAVPCSIADLNKSTVITQRNLGIQLVDRYPGFGRAVLRDRIDFAWVKEALRLCDARSPKRERTHDFNLRAINVD